MDKLRRISLNSGDKNASDSTRKSVKFFSPLIASSLALALSTGAVAASFSEVENQEEYYPAFMEEQKFQDFQSPRLLSNSSSFENELVRSMENPMRSSTRYSKVCWSDMCVGNGIMSSMYLSPLSFNNLIWKTDGDFKSPFSSGQTMIKGLLFTFDDKIRPGVNDPEGFSNGVLYQITIPNDERNEPAIILNGNGKGIKLASGGTLTIDYTNAPQERHRRSYFVLDLSDTNGNTSFEGNIEFNPGNPYVENGANVVSNRAEFQAIFARDVKGQIAIKENTNGYYEQGHWVDGAREGYYSGNRSDLQFRNTASLTGTLWVEAGTNNVSFDRGKLGALSVSPRAKKIKDDTNLTLNFNGNGSGVARDVTVKMNQQGLTGSLLGNRGRAIANINFRGGDNSIGGNVTVEQNGRSYITFNGGNNNRIGGNVVVGQDGESQITFNGGSNAINGTILTRSNGKSAITASNSTLTIGRMEVNNGGATNTLTLTNGTTNIGETIKSFVGGATNISLNSGKLSVGTNQNHKIETSQASASFNLSNGATLETKGAIYSYSGGNATIQASQRSNIALGTSSIGGRNTSLYANSSSNKITLTDSASMVIGGDVSAVEGANSLNYLIATGASLDVKGKVEANRSFNNQNILELGGKAKATIGALEAHGSARNILRIDNSNVTVGDVRSTGLAENKVVLRNGSVFKAANIHGGDGKNTFEVFDSTFEADKISFVFNGAGKESNVVVATRSNLIFGEILGTQSEQNISIALWENSTMTIKNAVKTLKGGKTKLTLDSGRTTIGTTQDHKIETFGGVTKLDLSNSASLTTKGAIHTHAQGEAIVNLNNQGQMTLGSTNLSGNNASIYSNNATNTITVDNATLNAQGIMVATGGGYANNIINASNGATITLAGVTGYNPSNVKGRNTNTITASSSTLTIGRMEVSDGYKNDRTDKDEGATNALTLTNSNAIINGIVKTSQYGKTRITLDGGSLQTAQEIATTEGLTKVTLSNNATLDLKGIFDTYGRGNVIVEANQSTITLGKSNRANRDVSIYANNSDNKLTLSTGSELTTEGSVFAGGGGIASNTINATGATLNIKGKIETDWTNTNKNIINLNASTLTAGNLEANGSARNELTADNSLLTVADMRATSSAQNVVTLRGNSTFTAKDIYGADGKNIFNVVNSTFKANKLSFSPNGAESSNEIIATDSTLTFAEISTRSNGWHPKRKNVLTLTGSSLNIGQAIDSDPNGENIITVTGGKADSKIVTIGKKVFNNYGVNRYGSIRANAGTNTITLKGDVGLDAKGLLISVGGGTAENIIDATATSGRVTIGGVYTDGANNKNTIKMGNKTLYVNNPDVNRPNFEIVWGKSTIDAQAIQSDSGDLKFELRYGGKLYLSNGEGKTTKLISQRSNNFNIIGSDNVILGADLASESAFTLNNRSSLEMDSLSSSTNRNIQVNMDEATLRLTKGDSKISTLNLSNGNNVIELGNPSKPDQIKPVLTIGQNGQGLVSTKDSNSLTFVSYVNPSADKGKEASKVVILESGTPKGTYSLKPIYTDVDNLATIGSRNIALATVAHKANANANSSAMDKGIIKFTNGTTFNVNQGFDVVSTTLKARETNQDGANGNGFTTYFIDKAEIKGTDQSVLKTNETIAAASTNLYLANFNSLNKRMGELRDNAHSQGVWARGFYGNQSNDYGLKSQTEFYTVQGGYDFAFGLEGANNYFGFAVSYSGSNTTADSSNNKTIEGIESGIEELKTELVELALYNAYVQDSGWYNDTVAKFSMIRNSLLVKGPGAEKKVQFNNMAFMLSDEFGYRFKFGGEKEWFIDPQVEVSAGYITGSQYTQNEGTQTLTTAIDSRFILKSRLGTNIGYDFKRFAQNKDVNANLYVGVFGEVDYFANGAIKTGYETIGNPLGFDGRVVLNAGTNLTIKDNTRLYFDFESSFVGKIRTDYKVNVGARYSFGENKGYTPKSPSTELKAPVKLEKAVESEEIQEEEE